jgi:hypothetical protein
MERKTPAACGNGGLETLGGGFDDLSTPRNLQVQHLVRARRIRPAFASVLATAIYGGAHGCGFRRSRPLVPRRSRPLIPR